MNPVTNRTSAVQYSCPTLHLLSIMQPEKVCSRNDKCVSKRLMNVSMTWEYFKTLHHACMNIDIFMSIVKSRSTSERFQFTMKLMTSLNKSFSVYSWMGNKKGKKCHDNINLNNRLMFIIPRSQKLTCED